MDSLLPIEVQNQMTVKKNHIKLQTMFAVDPNQNSSLVSTVLYFAKLQIF